jgi:hypothetical protein
MILSQIFKTAEGARKRALFKMALAQGAPPMIEVRLALSLYLLALAIMLLSA